MKPIVAVLTCFKYRDAWAPFVKMFNKFWPDCPYPRMLMTDTVGETDDMVRDFDSASREEGGFSLFNLAQPTWKLAMLELVRYCKKNDFYPLLFQEDFLLSEKVKTDVVEEASLIHRVYQQVGCTRLYPCPGGDIAFAGTDRYGIVKKGSPYRVSCQLAFWHPDFLTELLSNDKIDNGWQFEIEGTKLSESLDWNVYSVMREARPWPIEYYCTAIVRGVWQKDAIDLLKRHGITVRGTRPIGG